MLRGRKARSHCGGLEPRAFHSEDPLGETAREDGGGVGSRLSTAGKVPLVFAGYEGLWFSLSTNPNLRF